MTEPELEPLLPCAHCGKEVKNYVYQLSEVFAACPCGISTRPFYFDPTDRKSYIEAYQKLAAAWNRRVFEPTSPFGSDKL